MEERKAITVRKAAIQAVNDAFNALGDVLFNDDEVHNALLDSDTFCALVADTNASDWHIDQLYFDSIKSVNVSDVLVSLTWVAAGVPQQDRVYCGHKAGGTVVILFKGDGSFELHELAGDILDYSE